MDAASQLRAAARMLHNVPEAKLEPAGVGAFTLDPGERAIVPVAWNEKIRKSVTECTTHPDAPTGLAVLPGTCDCETEYMSLVVENEGELPVTVTQSSTADVC